MTSGWLATLTKRTWAAGAGHSLGIRRVAEPGHLGPLARCWMRNRSTCGDHLRCLQARIGRCLRSFGVDTASLEIPIAFANFEDYWMPFLRGTGPALSYVASLDL